MNIVRTMLQTIEKGLFKRGNKRFRVNRQKTLIELPIGFCIL
jgi:hypothetical protein